MNPTPANINWVNTRLENQYGKPEISSERTPLESLVRTILSQNTSDVNSQRAYQNLREQYPTWEKVLSASQDALADAIRSGGLANQKSRRIQRLLTWLQENYGSFELYWICGEDPYEIIEQFTAIKGIGVKTIAIVLCFVCDKDIFPVDTHVNRVCQRLGFVNEHSPPVKTFWTMDDHIPGGRAKELHLNMIAHGRSTCRARNPECSDCVLLSKCVYGQDNLKEQA